MSHKNHTKTYILRVHSRLKTIPSKLMQMRIDSAQKTLSAAIIVCWLSPTDKPRALYVSKIFERYDRAACKWRKAVNTRTYMYIFIHTRTRMHTMSPRNVYTARFTVTAVPLSCLRERFIPFAMRSHVGRELRPSPKLPSTRRETQRENRPRFFSKMDLHILYFLASVRLVPELFS